MILVIGIPSYYFWARCQVLENGGWTTPGSVGWSWWSFKVIGLDLGWSLAKHLDEFGKGLAKFSWKPLYSWSLQPLINNGGNSTPRERFSLGIFLYYDISLVRGLGIEMVAANHWEGQYCLLKNSWNNTNRNGRQNAGDHFSLVRIWCRNRCVWPKQNFFMS